jgi:peptidylprolyl isomerase
MSTSKGSLQRGGSGGPRPNSGPKRDRIRAPGAAPSASNNSDTAPSIVSTLRTDELLFGDEEYQTLKKKFQEIEERRCKEWESYQRSQRGTADEDRSTGTRVYLDFMVGDIPAGRMIFELFDEQCPETCKNFVTLCNGIRGWEPTHAVKLDYVDSPVHRVVKGELFYAGELGGHSLTATGAKLFDECYAFHHTSRGLLVMESHGPNTSGSAFGITLDACPNWDYRQVVFGRVVEGIAALEKIEAVPLSVTGCPKMPIVISMSGSLTGKKPVPLKSVDEHYADLRSALEAASGMDDGASSMAAPSPFPMSMPNSPRNAPEVEGGTPRATPTTPPSDGGVGALCADTPSARETVDGSMVDTASAAQ